MKRLIKPILIIVVMVLVAILAGGTIALAVSSRTVKKTMPMTTVDIARVQADAVSSSDGEKHRVLISFSIELSDSLASSIGLGETRKQLSKIISKLDYDMLITGDSVEYVVENVVQQLSANLDRDEIGNIYVTDMVTGPFTFFSADAEEEVPQKTFDVRNQQRFNALFSNSE